MTSGGNSSRRVRRVAGKQIYPLLRIADLDFKFCKMLIVFLINQKDYESCKLRNTLMRCFSNVSHQLCLFTALMDVIGSDLSAVAPARHGTQCGGELSKAEAKQSLSHLFLRLPRPAQEAVRGSQ